MNEPTAPIALMLEELERSDPVCRPSRFWRHYAYCNGFDMSVKDSTGICGV